jgi:hypothetical protein
MPAQRTQWSTRLATTTTFGIAVRSLCASILAGSESARRLHTIWHETVLGIDSRTAR